DGVGRPDATVARQPGRRSARRVVVGACTGVRADSRRLTQRRDARGRPPSRFHARGRNRLSRHVALPVIAGATLLKGIRLRRRGLPPGMRAPFAAGVAAAFVSTLASRWLIQQVERDRSLAPYAAYRIALAALA